MASDGVVVWSRILLFSFGDRSVQRRLQRLICTSGNQLKRPGSKSPATDLNSDDRSLLTYRQPIHASGYRNSFGMKLPSLSSEDTRNKIIELKSEIPLPRHWEQILNLKTGELYYVNRRTGERSSNPPQKILPFFKTCGGQSSNTASLAPTVKEEQLEDLENNFVPIPVICEACSIYVNLYKREL